MRVLAALFFIAFFPVIVFLATILYGGITPQIIKTSLSASGVYKLLPGMLAESMTSEESEADGVGQIFTIIQDKFAGSYLQDKSEKLIDDTDLWMRGKTDEVPVISFSEIKTEIMDSNPELLEMMKEGMTTMKEQTEAEGGQSMQEDESMKGFNEFMENDFTIPVGKNLTPLKDGYKNLTIILPILIVLELIAGFVIIFFSHGISSKLKWGGVVLTISAIYGFIWVFSGNGLFSIVTVTIKEQENEIVRLITPIILTIASQFIETYKTYQMNISVGAIVVGAVAFASSFLVNKTPVVMPLTAKKKK